MHKIKYVKADIGSYVSTPKLSLPLLAGQLRGNSFYAYIKGLYYPFSASFSLLVILLGHTHTLACPGHVTDYLTDDSCLMRASWITLHDGANLITKPMAGGRKLFVRADGKNQFEFEL